MPNWTVSQKSENIYNKDDVYEIEIGNLNYSFDSKSNNIYESWIVLELL